VLACTIVTNKTRASSALISIFVPNMLILKGFFTGCVKLRDDLFLQTMEVQPWCQFSPMDLIVRFFGEAKAISYNGSPRDGFSQENEICTKAGGACSEGISWLGHFMAQSLGCANTMNEIKIQEA
jgi:hypothetical protein